MSEQNLATIDIKGKKYVPVHERVRYFNETYPDGKIVTDMISGTKEPLVFIKATVTPDIGKPDRFFTGYSQAKWGEGYINKSSALENAETSAVGRALGFMGIGIIESLCTADEIYKAKSQTISEDDFIPVTKEQDKKVACLKIRDWLKIKKIPESFITKDYECEKLEDLKLEDLDFINGDKYKKRLEERYSQL